MRQDEPVVKLNGFTFAGPDAVVIKRLTPEELDEVGREAVNYETQGQDDFSGGLAWGLGALLLPGVVVLGNQPAMCQTPWEGPAVIIPIGLCIGTIWFAARRRRMRRLRKGIHFALRKISMERGWDPM